jgi:uncharacterized protein involved in outer membrane biogenesis
VDRAVNSRPPLPLLRRPAWRWAAAGLLGVALLIVMLILGVLIAADRGMLDRPIARWASARLGRPVRFGSLQAHLLSRKPTLTIDDLEIGNPGWLGGGNLAEAQRISAELELGPLLRGALKPRVVAVEGLHLHLVRIGPQRNNWSFTASPRPGPAFAPLSDVADFSISRGTIDFRDYARGLTLAGAFRHDREGAAPFKLTAQGALAGFPISLTAEGGQLNGPGVGPPWPLTARLVDAATVVTARGTTMQPFGLTRFDLAVSAAGPNLADLGYLFHLITPNSAPYRLTTQAQTDGEHFGFSALRGRIGGSDIDGWIKSDHETERRAIKASFRSHVLAKSDIDALLAPVPPRAAARVGSGAVKAIASGRWLLPDASFGLARLRAADLDFEVRADRVQGYSLPLRDIVTRIQLDRGILRFPHFSAGLYGGRLSGGTSLDARAGNPTLAIRGTLSGAQLADISPRAGKGALDLAMDLRGSGASVHEAAARASGSMRMRLIGAAIPRRAGWILGGDLLRALGGGSSKLGPDIPVTCAVASFSGSGGRMVANGLSIETPLGVAGGSGMIDLGQERIRLLIEGRPLHKRLFQVAVPLLVEGSLRSPTVSLLPGDKARQLGLKGDVGVALTPLTGLLPVAPGRPAARHAGC